MAKVKKYSVKITQSNGVVTISKFTKKEIADRIKWWLTDFEKVTISKEEIKEYKF